MDNYQTLAEYFLRYGVEDLKKMYHSTTKKENTLIFKKVQNFVNNCQLKKSVEMETSLYL